MKKILILSFVLLLSLYSFSQSTIQFEKSGYDQFMQKAKDENKLTMIYFTGTGCSLCKKMERNVFVVPEVYNLYNRDFVNVESYDDWDKPDASTKALRKKYNVISNPTFLFLDRDGNVVHRAGYAEKDFFVTIAKQASGNDNYRNWSAKIAAGDYSPELVAKYLSVELPARLYAEKDFDCPAQTVLENYFKTVPEKEYTSAVNWNIINRYVANPYSAIFNYLTKHQTLYTEKYGKVAVDKKIFDTYYDAWSGATNTEAYKKAEATARSSEVPMAKVLVKIRDMNNRASEIKRDKKAGWQEFIQENDAAVRDNAHVIVVQQVNDWVEDICQKHPNDRNMIVAVNKWMGVLLSYPKNKVYDHCATYAKTFYLLGDKINAARIQKEAIELSKNYEMDKEEIKELEDALQLYMKK